MKSIDDMKRASQKEIGKQEKVEMVERPLNYNGRQKSSAKNGNNIAIEIHIMVCLF